MKKITAFLSATVIAMSLMACSAPEEPTSSTPESSVAPTATPIPTASPTATPTPTPTQAPTPEPEIPEELTNLLTGERDLTEEAIGARPIALMVNNSTDNLPQYGISEADIIFEIPVEGDMTRLMAMYGDYTDIPSVCSIRSARYYFPQIAVGFDAVYTHWGENKSHATPVIDSLGIDNIDAMYAPSYLFGRDQDRLNSGYAYEHSSVFYGEEFPTYVENNNYRIEISEDKSDPFFNFNEESTKADGEALTDFQFHYGAYFSDFTYDTKSETYLKEHNGSPHVDGVTGEQLAFENVILLETAVSLMPDGTSGIKQINVMGENKPGYYISKGTIQEITWSKPYETSEITLYSLDGEELFINTGKTYIGVGSPDFNS